MSKPSYGNGIWKSSYVIRNTPPNAIEVPTRTIFNGAAGNDVFYSSVLLETSIRALLQALSNAQLNNA